MKPVYQELISKIVAMQNCNKSENFDWYDRHELAIEEIENNNLPSGSGIDSGTRVNLDKTTANKLVIDSSYHCMNQDGYYDGWIDFTVTVTPSLLSDIDIDIKGNFSQRHNKYADVKDYLYDVFNMSLCTLV